MNTPLITATELADCLLRPQAHAHTVVVDCRFNLGDVTAGESAWQQAHIPGAHYAHLDRDLSGPKTGTNGRHPLPPAHIFAQTLQRWGVHANTQVVAYDDAGGMFAARLWWMLTHWFGHSACAVLDGGWQHWTQQGQVTDGAPVVAMNQEETDQAIQADEAQAGQVVTAQQVLAAIQQAGSMLLIDARAPDRFVGLNETLDPVGGHIPGAINRFFKDNLQANGCFKTPAQLRNEFAALIGPGAPTSVVHQCGSGVTACHNLLAMDLAGLPGSKLYAGSWSEWCADPARPVER